jgi:hypothetical protein
MWRDGNAGEDREDGDLVAPDRPSYTSRKQSPTPYPPEQVACRCTVPVPDDSGRGFVECARCGFLILARRR